MKVKSVICKVLVGTIGAAGAAGTALAYLGQKSLKRETEVNNRNRQRYELSYQWLENCLEGISSQDYLKRENIKKIAIYGMGDFGEVLLKELEASDISVAYIIDKELQKNRVGAEIPFVQANEVIGQECVDAIVITPVYYFDEIKKNLLNAGVQCRLISLRDIVFEL